MPKRKLLNVKDHLERIEKFCDTLVKDNQRWPNGLVMPPAYLEEAQRIAFMTRCILKVNAEKKTRKDIRIEGSTR